MKVRKELTLITPALMTALRFSGAAPVKVRKDLAFLKTAMLTAHASVGPHP